MGGRVEDGGKAGFHDAFAVGAVPLRAQPLRARPAGVCRSFDYGILPGDGTFPVRLVYGQFRRLPLDLRRICRRAVFPAVVKPAVDAGLGRGGADFVAVLLAGRGLPQGIRLARTI